MVRERLDSEKPVFLKKNYHDKDDGAWTEAKNICKMERQKTDCSSGNEEDKAEDSDKMRHFSYLVEMVLFFRASSYYKDHLVDMIEFCYSSF